MLYALTLVVAVLMAGLFLGAAAIEAMQPLLRALGG